MSVTKIADLILMVTLEPRDVLVVVSLEPSNLGPVFFLKAIDLLFECLAALDLLLQLLAQLFARLNFAIHLRLQR